MKTKLVLISVLGFGLQGAPALADDSLDNRIQNRGDQVDGRLANKSDRVDRRLDNLGERMERRYDRRNEAAGSHRRDNARRMERRRDRDAQHWGGGGEKGHA